MRYVARRRVIGWLVYLAIVLVILLGAWVERSLCDGRGGVWSTCGVLPRQ